MMETTLFELNYLGESSKRELAAYRNIGTVQALRRLKRQEIRRQRRMERCLDALTLIMAGISAAFMLWVFVSWIDVVTHNLDPNPVYQAWNFFDIAF